MKQLKPAGRLVRRAVLDAEFVFAIPEWLEVYKVDGGQVIKV